MEVIGVNRRARIAVKSVVSHVAHDPDNAERMQIAVHVSVLDLLADCVLVRPVTFRQRFAHDRDVRRVGSVAFLEKPATDQ